MSLSKSFRIKRLKDGMAIVDVENGFTSKLVRYLAITSLNTDVFGSCFKCKIEYHHYVKCDLRRLTDQSSVMYTCQYINNGKIENPYVSSLIRLDNLSLFISSYLRVTL